MSYQIEKDIPLTPRVRPSKYPFGDLEIGDSFLVPGIKAAKLRTTANTYRKANPGFAYAVRDVEGGARLWRVEAE